LNDQAGTFLKNVASLTTANFLARIVGAVVSIVVINHLGQERFGDYSLAMAFATVFLIFAETGVGTRFLYDRSADKAAVGEHFGAAIFLQMVPYLGALAVTMLAATFVFDYSRTVVTLIAIVSTSAILRIFAEICERAINLYQKMHLTAILRSLRFAIIAAGGIVIVWADKGPVEWAIVTLVAMAFSAVATAAVAFRFVWPKLVWSTLWPTLKSSYMFGIGAVFFAIYDKLDQVMLNEMSPAETARAVVGTYGAAYSLISFVYTLPGSFIASLEPVAYGARGDRPKLAYLGNISSRMLGALGIPFAVGTALLATDVQKLLLPKYPDAAPALVVLALFAAVRFINYPAGIFMAAADLQKRRAAVQGAATVVNVVLNFIFIPKYGLLGAAGVTVATETFIYAMYTLSLARRLPGYLGPLCLARPAIASGVMAAALLGVRRVAPGLAAASLEWFTVPESLQSYASALAHLVILALPGTFVYFAALLGLGFLRAEEKAMARRVFARLAFWRSSSERRTDDAPDE
jgi:O-antigen/teichoic acid export membrane protein